MRPDDRIRLRHMIDAAEAALGFAAGRTRARVGGGFVAGADRCGELPRAENAPPRLRSCGADGSDEVADQRCLGAGIGGGGVDQTIEHLVARQAEDVIDAVPTRPRAAASFGVPAPICWRIRMPRLWPATWIR